MKLHFKFSLMAIFSTAMASLLVLWFVVSQTNKTLLVAVNDESQAIEKQLEDFQKGYLKNIASFATYNLLVPIYLEEMDKISEISEGILQQPNVLNVLTFDADLQVLYNDSHSYTGLSLDKAMADFVEVMPTNPAIDHEVQLLYLGLDSKLLVDLVTQTLGAPQHKVNFLSHGPLYVMAVNIMLYDESQGGLLVFYDSRQIQATAQNMAVGVHRSLSQSVDKSSFNAGYLSLAIVFLSVMVTLLLTKRLTKPLRLLAKQMHLIGRGEYRLSTMPTGKDEVGALGRSLNNMVRDLQQTTVSRDQFKKLAQTDTLTGLANRHYFETKMKENMALCQQHNTKMALFIVDLDDFKQINDVEGHRAGDQILSYVAENLKNCIRANNAPFEDVACRIGGDEFTLQINGVEDKSDMLKLANRLVDSVLEPKLIDGKMLQCGCSIGISVFPEDGSNYEQLLSSADAALYQIKRSGKGGVGLYNQEIAESFKRDSLINRILHNPFNEIDMWLEYQPQVNAKTSRVVGAEALLRVRDSQLGRISPIDFVRCAEQGGRMVDLDKWVISSAIQQVKHWQGTELGQMVVAINISTQTIARCDLTAFIAQELLRYGVSPSLIDIEITESAEIDEGETTLAQFRSLRALGVKLSIDDFGTGYSNLRYLRDIHASRLKIDRSFISACSKSKADQILVRSIVSLARELNMETVAEGVETDADVSLVTKLGCNMLQGYVYSPSMIPADFVRFVRDQHAQIASV